MSETSTEAAHREVGFQDAIKLFFGNYFNFEGRSSRGAYWWYMLFSIGVTIILGLIDSVIAPNAPAGPLGGIFSLAVFIPGIGLSVRRLHDIDKSGWWCLSALLVLPIFLLIYWACQPGQRSDNQFGADVEAGR